MPKNNLRGISLVRGPILGIHSLTLIISWQSLIGLTFLSRSTKASSPVLEAKLASMAAAGTIHVWMEEPAMKSVSQPAFGTTVLVRNRLLEDTARFRPDVVKTTKQLGWTSLDCTKLSTIPIKPSKCSVILIQSLRSRGIWSSRLVCPTKTVFR